MKSEWNFRYLTKKLFSYFYSKWSVKKKSLLTVIIFTVTCHCKNLSKIFQKSFKKFLFHNFFFFGKNLFKKKIEFLKRDFLDIEKNFQYFCEGRPTKKNKKCRSSPLFFLKFSNLQGFLISSTGTWWTAVRNPFFCFFCFWHFFQKIKFFKSRFSHYFSKFQQYFVRDVQQKKIQNSRTTPYFSWTFQISKDFWFTAREYVQPAFDIHFFSKIFWKKMHFFKTWFSLLYLYFELWFFHVTWKNHGMIFSSHDFLTVKVIYCSLFFTARKNQYGYVFSRRIFSKNFSQKKSYPYWFFRAVKKSEQ
jgi:hypothetical protein